MTGAVPIWETDRSLHPTLTIVAASSARDLAQALAAGLEGAGYELSGSLSTPSSSRRQFGFAAVHSVGLVFAARPPACPRRLRRSSTAASK